MWTKQKRRCRNRFVLPAVTVCILSYFGYHLSHGEYGLYSQERLGERIALLKTEQERLKSQRVALEKKIILLRDGAVEKDMLDEYARKNLNLSLSNELTIVIPTISGGG